jgi:hypothetical protein
VFARRFFWIFLENISCAETELRTGVTIRTVVPIDSFSSPQRSERRLGTNLNGTQYSWAS